MLKLDSPSKKKNELSTEQKKHNKQLAERYNKNGIFPYVVVINAKGKVLGSTGYKKASVNEYITELNSFLK